jgi:hypothetical protein
MYGDKVSKAILSNLSYQFFGKVNELDTAKYYERFFEIAKDPTKRLSHVHNLDFLRDLLSEKRKLQKFRLIFF